MMTSRLVLRRFHRLLQASKGVSQPVPNPQFISLRGLRKASTPVSGSQKETSTEDLSSEQNTDEGEQNDTGEEKTFRRPPLKKLLRNSATYLADEPPTEQYIDPFISGPYVKGDKVPEDVVELEKQDREPVEDPRINPKSTSVIQFPGDGCQYLGMCGDPRKFPPYIRVMYEMASEILKIDMIDLMMNGPIEKLNMTRYSQPAIVVASLAALENLRDQDPSAVESCVITCGFSVGEISALIFSGALTFEEGMHLVKYRAEAMQLAGHMTPSGLALVFYGPDSRLDKALDFAREWCVQEHRLPVAVCQPAYHLFPHCKVVGGNKEALDFLEKNQKDFRLKKVKRLPAEAAFHTRIMHPASEPVKTYLNTIELKAPLMKVFSSVTGGQYGHPGHIKKCLGASVHSSVKWEQVLHHIYTRAQNTSFPRTYECGPGRTLGSVMRLVNRKAHDSYHSVQPSDFPELVEAHDFN